MKSKQSFLSDIVKTWKVNLEPEFRGFRCGLCQQEIIEAWHYMFASDAYKVMVHVCEKCQKDTNIEADLSALPHRQAGDEAEKYKAFECGVCHAPITEAWHIWNKEGTRLTEKHLCKTCGNKIYD